MASLVVATQFDVLLQRAAPAATLCVTIRVQVATPKWIVANFSMCPGANLRFSYIIIGPGNITFTFVRNRCFLVLTAVNGNLGVVSAITNAT